MRLTFIYLAEQEKKDLMKLCTKYKVSLSNLTSCLIKTTYYCLLHYGINKDENKILQEKYIVVRNNLPKTSIKPRCFKDKEAFYSLIENKNMYATNCLLIYTSKRQLDYMTEEGKNHYFNMLNQELQNNYEAWWDYNTFIRKSRRNLKENKDYYKRAIEEMENK